MNWLDYKKSKGQTINPFDEDNAHVPAEVMPDYEPALMDTPYWGKSVEAPQMMPSGQLAGVDEPPATVAAPAPAEKPLLGTEDLRRLLTPKAQKPAPDVKAAMALDRKRQNQDDLRNLLLQAATRGQSGQLRNLGHPETQLAQSQQKPQEDELSRAMKVAQLKKLLEPKERNPFADELAQAQIDNYRALTALHGRQGHPNPGKTNVTAPENDDLTPEEEALLEMKLGLPKGSLTNVRRKTVGIIPKKVTAQGGKPKTPDDGLLKLTPTVANEFSDFDVADAQLDQVERDFKNYDVGGKFYDRAAAAMTDWAGLNNDYSAYKDSANRAVKVVGKIIEGGKLAEGDMAQYRELIPRSGDSIQRMHQKIAGLRQFLADIKSGRIRFYRMPKAGTVTIREKKTGETHQVQSSELDALKAEDDWNEWEVVP